MLELSDNNYEISMINILRALMEAMENINIRTEGTGSRGLGTLRKICKRKFF